MTLKGHLEGEVRPYEEHYNEEYWQMVRQLQEVFGRTSRPGGHDQVTYEACRQRMGAQKVIGLARGHRQQVLDKVGNQNPWSYFRGILQSRLNNPEAEPSGCPECGHPPVGKAYPESYVRRQGVRLSYLCPLCSHVHHSEWCYPPDGKRPTERWGAYALQRQKDRVKSQKWKEALRER